MVVGGLFLLVAVLPVLTLAGLIRLTSPGPALFTQQRIGQYGRPFTLYKLRTMRQDAEAQLADVLDGAVGVYYKPKADPG
nr:hypothetical protein GCM10025730_37520 [Promicromonospora thailandica]